MGPIVFNRAGLDKPFDAKLAVIRFVAHTAQFSDGDVVAFVRPVTGEGKPGDRAHDNHRRNPDSHCVCRNLHDNFNDTSVSTQGQPSDD